MRVTNNLIYDQSNRAISRSNEKILNIQEKISSQTDIVKPSDDPVGASQVLMYKGDTHQLKMFDDAINMANSHLEYQEVALDSINDAMDRIRSLFIQSHNDINTPHDLKAIAQEIGLITDSMADMMNSRSADGSYIFAGTNTQSPPFVLNGMGRYEWRGNEGQKFAQISETMRVAVSDSGKKLFQDAWTDHEFSSTLQSGDVSLSTKVNNRPDFKVFLDEFYDPEDETKNVYTLTTQPILGAEEQGELASLDDSTYTGSDTVEDQKRRRTFNGTVGSYSITNSDGDVVSSGSYKAGTPISLGGMSFLLSGQPGAVVEFSLNQPRRDNVLNEILDSLVVLKDASATLEDREKALFDATTSLNNAQRAVGEARSEVGGRLNILRDREDFSSANQLSNAVVLDRISGLDMAAAATELSLKESALDASQTVFSRISNMSLFNKM